VDVSPIDPENQEVLDVAPTTEEQERQLLASGCKRATSVLISRCWDRSFGGLIRRGILRGTGAGCDALSPVLSNNAGEWKEERYPRHCGPKGPHQSR
jgi:hypothetical protein